MQKIKIILLLLSIGIISPIAFYTLSPLFVNTEVNEPFPIEITDQDYQKFMQLDENDRAEIGKQMTNEQKNAIMLISSKINNTVTEAANYYEAVNNNSNFLVGSFVGVNDGIHNANGFAKIIHTSNGTQILRLENFMSTNGPDLYVYLATDKSALDFINLGKLKGNIGNQNYNIPIGTDLNKYNQVLIWCKAFSVLFGNAQLLPK